MPDHTRREGATGLMLKNGALAQQEPLQSRALAICSKLQGFYAKRFAAESPLSSYAVTVFMRCLIIAALSWSALSVYYDVLPLSSSAWFVLSLLSAVVAFVCASSLGANLPKASSLMQFAAILFIWLSLFKGSQMHLLSSKLVWGLPLLACMPALYAALRRDLELFALAGYMAALLLPVLTGLPAQSALFFFGYYLVLLLPLPLITAMRGWRYLSGCVFAWVFASTAYYLGIFQQNGVVNHAQALFAPFVAVYALTVFVAIRQPKFNILHFVDFFLAVGLALGVVACQMRIAFMQNGEMLVILLVLAVLFIAAGFAVRLTAWERSPALCRIYLLFALFLLNGCFALICPGTIALVVYCIEAVLLFALGSARAMLRIKAGGFLILILTPFYFFFAAQHLLVGAAFVGASFICCAYIQDRELKRLALRSGRHPWSSRLEFFLVFFGFAYCFAGMAVYVFKNIPGPGLIYFAVSSASAYFFYAFGKLVRLRSLRVAIFIPMLISIPAALLPFIYQMRIEWPVLNHVLSYNYLTGLGALAWVSYFITVWTALYHSWGGLISNRTHAWLLALVTLELVLVLTSSGRAFALESGVSPSVLSVLGALPSLGCIFVLAHLIKIKPVDNPYRTPIYIVVPWVLFIALALWFVGALSSPGSAAPNGKYIPLLNPVEMVQLISIVLFGHWQRRLRRSAISGVYLSAGVILWVYAVSSFLWLHGLMFRVVQYFSQAQMQDVLSFVELRLIFACIWIVYGVLVWLGSTLFRSTLSWLVSVLLLSAGVLTLMFIVGTLWGKFALIIMSIAGLFLFALLTWRSPAPFTQRGRELAERG